MRRILTGLMLVAFIASCEDVDLRWVTLPEGVTALSRIGIYRVAYQRYGQDVVEMPPSWSGYFTPDSGIAFQQIHQEEKPGLLLHCPWRGGTGAVFVEYSLVFPKVTPIALDFAITMRPDVVGKSDGVTFTVALTCDGATKKLVHEHYAAGTPKPFHFDLSSYAGKRVVLRIQTEPGPAKSASFDFSRFIDPRITVGTKAEVREDTVARMTNTKAYRVLSRVNLTRVVNDPGRGIVPSYKIRNYNEVKKGLGGEYTLSYQADDCKLVYRYTPKTGTLDDFICRIDDTKPFRPCSSGGVFFEVDGKKVRPKAKLLSHKIEKDRIVATWKYSAGDQSATVEWRFGISGKALVIEAKSDDLTISKFSLGRVGAVDFRKRISIPYLAGWAYQCADYLPVQNAFVLAYIDWTKSHASRSPATESYYIKKLDGKRNALRESGYVAVSPDLDEVLPNIPHPPSPYLRLLGSRMMVDIWGGMYEEDAKMLEEYKSYGMDEIAIIKHVWQCYGYDVKLPDHLPANPRYGGDEKMKILAATAKRLGYVFSLHENYIDFYPDAPSWNPKDVVLTPKGEFSKAWYHKGTKVQSFALKTNRMLHYAKQNSPEIHRRFGTTAAYLDVHTCVPPWHHVDYEADQEMAGMYAAKVKYQAKLFQFERDTHKGPLFGEGAGHFYWAGLVDGVEAQVHGGEDHDVLVDFDLLKIHPQMVNHGMGYYTRWLRTRKETKWGVDAPTPEQLDKYRAQEIAYGHASFVGSQLWKNLPLVIREYNLCQPVQALYGDAKVTEIMYEVDGKFVTSSVAAVVGVLDRLRVKYDSGLVLHVNLRQNDWTVRGHVLPQYGFLAEGPGTLVYTAKRDGVIADFARTKNSLYVDSRTEIVAPWTRNQKNVEPRLKAFKYLGGRKFAITYEWQINDTFDKDLHCFVHFCNKDAKRPDDIAFQNDHGLPKPTSQWKPGMILADGPYTVEIPEDCPLDSFDILIGLHKGGRVNLAGVSAGGGRIAIGRLAVTRKDGKVTNIKLVGIDDLKKEQNEKRKRFTDRLNVAGRKIDFGSVATDGSFKVLVREDGLELLPFPRDRKFRIELDLRPLLPKQPIAKAKITAVDAKGKAIGNVASKLANGRLTFDAGTKGAARYQIRAE
ncbi:MAG: hypothetical protein GXP25_07955 [Planctomycetes bacterium]|nr:hypothetical protein [Planctomycetota bacterium]